MKVPAYYKHLPAFCRFLLDEQLEPLVKEILFLGREENPPVLGRLAHLSGKQLFQITWGIVNETLLYLYQNRAKELIENSVEKWKRDQLGIIGQYDLTADDINLLYYVQGRALRRFIPLFTGDVTLSLELVDELNSFHLSSITAATNAYIDLLKQGIARREKELLEAQRIAHIGNFELDETTGKIKGSPEIYRIFEVAKGIGFEAFLEFIHPDDRERVQQTIRETIRTGAYETEFRYLKNDTLKHIWSKGIAAATKEGHPPTRIIGTIQDITQLKKAEQGLIEKTVALERSNESLQQFAYVASHDLQEPIRKIATFTDRALSGGESLSENLRSHLKKVYSLALLTRRMIDDILTYTSLVQWQEMQNCNLEDLVKEAMDLLEQSIEEKNAVIEVCCPSPIKVVAAQMRQLFRNVLSNALKFSRPEVPPKISITCRWLAKDDIKDNKLVAAEKYLHISVQDNGIGFNTESSEKIFGLFHRLHSKNDYEGSGLGLAIVKRIVDNHGGLIFVRSRIGEGTTFTFIIPQ